jgi:hypothetical protein
MPNSPFKEYEENLIPQKSEFRKNIGNINILNKDKLKSEKKKKKIQKALLKKEIRDKGK